MFKFQNIKLIQPLKSNFCNNNPFLKLNTSPCLNNLHIHSQYHTSSIILSKYKQEKGRNKTSLKNAIKAEARTGGAKSIKKVQRAKKKLHTTKQHASEQGKQASGEQARLRKDKKAMRDSKQAREEREAKFGSPIMSTKLNPALRKEFGEGVELEMFTGPPENFEQMKHDYDAEETDEEYEEFARQCDELEAKGYIEEEGADRPHTILDMGDIDDQIKNIENVEGFESDANFETDEDEIRAKDDDDTSVEQPKKERKLNKTQEDYGAELNDEFNTNDVEDNELVNIDGEPLKETGQNLQSLKQVKSAVETIRREGGTDIVIIEMTEKCDWADHFIIATCRSGRNMRAISESLRQEFEDPNHVALGGNFKKKKVATEDDDDWTSVGTGTLAIHLFSERGRRRYNLEGLWGPKIYDVNKDPNLAYETNSHVIPNPYDTTEL